MTLGIVLIILGFFGYISNVFLMKYYLEKRRPGVLDNKEKLNGQYEWEYTAGTGAVPRLVSFYGIIAVVIFIIGIILLIISFL